MRKPSKKDQPGRRLLTGEEVQMILHVGKNQVRELANRKIIKRLRFGHRSVRYTTDSVERLVRGDTLVD